MTQYRTALPQLSDALFLTDGGIETTLIFKDGVNLPYFAAFDLLRTEAGVAALRHYFVTYAKLARRYKMGIVLESATWRANPDWGTKLGYTPKNLAQANRAGIALLESIRQEFETPQAPIVISGCVGPRGDGYVPSTAMSVQAAAEYHGKQIAVFAEAGADMVCAITMNYVEEAIGIVQAARDTKMPVVISFTVETDGRIPTGQTLESAIDAVDAATSSYPIYYMINCAHPSHFEAVLTNGGKWVGRIRGIRANASRMSHAQLNETLVLDAGNPIELGQEYAALRRRFGHFNVVGGCCGTDHRHVEQIALACRPRLSAVA